MALAEKRREEGHDGGTYGIEVTMSYGRPDGKPELSHVPHDLETKMVQHEFEEIVENLRSFEAITHNSVAARIKMREVTRARLKQKPSNFREGNARRLLRGPIRMAVIGSGRSRNRLRFLDFLIR